MQLKRNFWILWSPWLLFIPVLISLEIRKLELAKTWKLSREDRQNFFLKIAMPGLEDDYFSLLKKAKAFFGCRPVTYSIEVGEELTDFVKLMVRNYSVFGLRPARFKNSENVSFRLIYRASRQDPAGEMIDRVEGPHPSFIMEGSSIQKVVL